MKTSIKVSPTILQRAITDGRCELAWLWTVARLIDQSEHGEHGHGGIGLFWGLSRKPGENRLYLHSNRVVAGVCNYGHYDKRDCVLIDAAYLHNHTLFCDFIASI